MRLVFIGFFVKAMQLCSNFLATRYQIRAGGCLIEHVNGVENRSAEKGHN